jgi:hypothetical protein
LGTPHASSRSASKKKTNANISTLSNRNFRFNFSPKSMHQLSWVNGLIRFSFPLRGRVSQNSTNGFPVDPTPKGLAAMIGRD